MHCDLNNFFASVEAVLDPSLLTVGPYAVCGNVELRQGIVLAKCPKAKAAGVKTGDAVWMAKQKCPGIKIIPPRHGVYSKFSARVKEVYSRFTDKVESFGIDECWLDISSSAKLFGNGIDVSKKIRDTVKDEVGLSLSIGVSWNKTYAKIASDQAGVGEIIVVTRKNYKSVIYPLPASSMLFVGRKSAKLFEKLNIRTIGDLAEFDPSALAPYLGINAHKLIKAARGEDDEPVGHIHDKEVPKSVGNGATLPKDINTIREIEQVIYVLAEEVGTRMRKKGVKGGTVSLSIRSPDLTWNGAQEGVRPATSNASAIMAVALKILPKIHKVSSDGKCDPVRSVRISVSGLESKKQSMQLSFLEDLHTDKEDKLSALFDNIRKKHGSDSILFGTAIGGLLDAKWEVTD